MATLRDLRKRIKSVKNTQKITRAMKMVAASKLRRAQMAILAARPYALRMDEVLNNVVKKADLESHPLLAYRVPRKVELLVLTSNRGLCGSFNSNILRTADQFLKDGASKYESVRVSAIGRKSKEFFERRGENLIGYYDGVSEKPNYEQAAGIAQDLANRFKDGNTDAVYLLYNEFKSAIAQNVTLYELLPMRPLDGWEERAAALVGELGVATKDGQRVAGRGQDLENMRGADAEWDAPSPALEAAIEDGYEHLFEPDRDAVLDALLPQHLAVQIWRALLESSAAEHGARMSAMDAASRNATDVIDRLTVSFNRARQAAITTELVEIVSGAAALEG